MSTLVFTQIIGPVFIAAAIGFLSHPKFYNKIIKDFEQNKGLTYFTGMMVMILGLIVILNHNIWEWSGAGIITFFGWAALLKGATFLIIPNLLFSWAHVIYKNKTVMKVAMFLTLAMGIYLSYVGYLA